MGGASCDTAPLLSVTLQCKLFVIVLQHLVNNRLLCVQSIAKSDLPQIFSVRAESVWVQHSFLVSWCLSEHLSRSTRSSRHSLSVCSSASSLLFNPSEGAVLQEQAAPVKLMNTELQFSDEFINSGFIEPLQCKGTAASATQTPQ